MNIEIRREHESDVAAALEVLDGASAWLRSRGVAQWPERFPEAVFAAAAERGELYLALDGSDPVGTVSLQRSDSVFWGERQDAGFLHRLAVRRSHPGLGHRLIDWADGEVERRGRRYLCLDTVSSNRRLREYYESLGFTEVAEIDGPAGHPHSAQLDAWHATLYQRRVGVHRGPNTGAERGHRSQWPSGPAG